MLTKKSIESWIKYALCFAAMLATPYVAKPIAKLFDWVGYGQVRPFFVHLFTVILWFLEIMIYLLVKRAFKKQENGQAVAETMEENAATVAETVVENVETSETVEAAENVEETVDETAQAPTEKKRKKKKVKKERKPAHVLPLLNVGILTAIVIACILVISPQIEWEVKPFYDMGEKITGYELLEKIGFLARNCMMCLWIVFCLQACDTIATEAFAKHTEQSRKWLVPLLTGAMCLLFGLFDVLSTSNAYAWTYLLFYLVFTAVYYVAQKHNVKTALLILFIYVF